MTLHIYAMKNRLSGIFERPFAENVDPKVYPELLAQSLALAPVEALVRHGEFDIYYLGTFDSKSGSLVSGSCDFVMSLEQLCNSYINAKKEK